MGISEILVLVPSPMILILTFYVKIFNNFRHKYYEITFEDEPSGTNLVL
jgi:hypothetical protein